MHALRIPGTSLSQRHRHAAAAGSAHQAVPEVDERGSPSIGTAEVATDPMPPSVADTLHHAEGPQATGRTRASPRPSSSPNSKRQSGAIPGNNYEFTQPIQMRINELIAGVRADVAVKLYGDDLEQLARSAGRSRRSAAGIDGSADVKLEQVTGSAGADHRRPTCDALARYGLSIEDVQRDRRASRWAARSAGQVFEGDRRFDIVVRAARGDAA